MILKKNDEYWLIAKIYILVLSIFTFFRILLFFSEIHRVDLNTEFTTVLQTFLMGLRFDIVISGYILILPALVLFLNRFIKNYTFIKKFTFYFILIFFLIAFTISSADIPYFNQFFARFSIGAFEWVNNLDFVFSMILQEPKYYIFIILYIFLAIIFYRSLKKIFTKLEYNKPKNILLEGLLTILLLGFIFLGIRGRIDEKSPIRIGTAYFSENSFLNQLGLNPVFTFIKSYLNAKDSDNQKAHLMDNQKAIKLSQQYLNIKQNNAFKSPIARNIQPDSSTTLKPNIVLIIMESMSAAKMKKFGNTDNLTPFLDSLSTKSYSFNNIYTAGEHTFNGIFSTLYSFPAIFRQHTMNDMRDFDGLPKILGDNGYSTYFFMTHDSQFDNEGGFLTKNHFNHIISKKDYPSEEIKTTLGVPDDYMFRFSIPIINELSNQKKPFLVTFMTTSDHGPFFIPDYYPKHHKDIRKQATSYADWSLRKFINLSKKQTWFDNTIFVFIADHGEATHAPYDISLDYHHSPMLFYAPKILDKPKEFNAIGGQIDLFPTLMGILKYPYINNTLGIDLLKEKRPFIIINADDKMGVLDTTHLLIVNPNQAAKMYHYKDSNKENCIAKYPQKAQEMETYLKANIQTYQYLLNNKLTTLNNE